jgi:hypothetical protein
VPLRPHMHPCKLHGTYRNTIVVIAEDEASA